MTLLALSGCGGRQEHRKVERQTPEPRAMAASKGSLVRSDPSDGRSLWSVQWDRATLDYGSDGSFGGSMEGVSGVLYGRRGASSRFRAQRAEASQKQHWLKLTGGVTLEATDPPSKLQCDEVLWDASADTIKAKGGVVLDAGDYRVGPFAQLWATPDLSYFSTPDLFERGRRSMQESKQP
ncbi:MAG: hypothetical protein N2109_10070 [Fimbriimonadales bacterium]|nr:hypothetical protein [Fimbriimonadales bacterium]